MHHPLAKELKEFIEVNIELIDKISRETLYSLFERATFNLEQQSCEKLMDILRFTLEIDNLYYDYVYPYILDIFNDAINKWKHNYYPKYNITTLVEVLEEFFLHKVTYEMDLTDQYHLCGINMADIADFILDKYNEGYFNNNLFIEDTDIYHGVLDIKILK